MDLSELQLRTALARAITDQPETDSEPTLDFGMLEAALTPPCAPEITRTPSLLPRSVAWAAGEAPIERPIIPAPSPDATLPKADWLIITWTRDEHRALARVFTPTNPAGVGNEYDKWYDYRKDFGEYAGDLRSQVYDPHPAVRSNRLGRYFLVEIGSKRVLLFKSELHMNQDGPRAYREGRPLPLIRMTQQLIREVQPKFLVSTGTAGGTIESHNVGDTVVSTSGVFHCGDPQDFRNADFNCKTFGITYWVNERLFERAHELMVSIKEYAIATPHPRYPQAPAIELPPVQPRIHGLKDLSIITTDFFEFGTTRNGLGKMGCAVEMGDGLVAKAIEELPQSERPKYVFVRNISDPVINGDIHQSLQVMWAVYFYQTFGLVTSFNSSLATWAIIAGN